MLKRSHKSTVLGWMVAFLAVAAIAGQVAAREAMAPRSGEAAILAALEETTTVDFIDESLGNVTDFWKKYHGIEIQIDTRALAVVNLSPETPVTARLDGIKLRSALNLILRELNLAWIIRDDVLIITTPEEAEVKLVSRVYDVGKLVSVRDPDGNLRPDFDPLIGAIVATVEPESWDTVGGCGRTVGLTYRGADALVVRQTQAVHEQVSQLLEDLARIVDESNAARPRTAEDAILAALDEKTTVDFLDEPSSAVADYFRENHNIEIQFDARTFNVPSMGSDFPVSKHLRNVTLRSALNLILRELGLDWIIRDEVLLITAQEEAERYLIPRVYDVTCLVNARDPDGEWSDAFWPLINTVTNTVEPESWDDSGGPGSIAPLEYRGAKVLVVRQSQRTHDKIAELLEDLRKIASKHEDDEQAADVEPALRAGEAAIVATLEEKTSASFIDESLHDVVDYFRTNHRIEIQIDTMALDMVNLESHVPVSGNLRNVKLRSALNLILGDLDLTWTIRDEVLWITTPEEAEEYAYARVYDVTNLARIVDEAGSPAGADFDRWIDLIETTVQPDTWESYPTICFLEYRGARVLVVPQTREVHEEIAQLLADLKVTADKYGEDVFPMVRSVQE